MSKARWLAADNRANRQAVLAERLATMLGIVLMLIGMTLAVLYAIPTRFMSAFLAWRIVAIPIIITAGLLWYLVRLQEVTMWKILLLGVAWLLYGMILLA